MPFDKYSDFQDCVNQNSDRGNPQAYCAQTYKDVTGKWPAEEEYKVNDSDKIIEMMHNKRKEKLESLKEDSEVKNMEDEKKFPAEAVDSTKPEDNIPKAEAVVPAVPEEKKEEQVQEIEVPEENKEQMPEEKSDSDKIAIAEILEAFKSQLDEFGKRIEALETPEEDEEETQPQPPMTEAMLILGENKTFKEKVDVLSKL